MQSNQLLLIEDDDADALLVQRALRGGRLRYDIARARSLHEGVDYLTAHPDSLVLTDLGLPDCGGLDAVSRLRAVTEEATIIVLSGQEDSETQLKALDRGAQDYLIKHEISPFTLERAIEHGTHRLKNQREVRQLLDAVHSQKSELQRQAKLLDQQNRRLRKLYKTAQQCVSNVSHDFRTPLTVVKEYASLIADGVVGEVAPEQVQMLRVIGDRVDDLNNMVDDMLDVSRHNSGLLGANRVSCSVSEIIKRLMPGLHQKAMLRGISLQINLADDLPSVFCDAEKLGRVLVNLIVNAIKFTDTGGQVHVNAEWRENAGEVRVSVRDTGQGISEQDCRLIFERFQQVKSGIQNTVKGFGLGLSIAKELVDLNLGDITVESQLGSGSIFAFSVPIDDASEVAKRYFSRLKSASRGRAHVSCIRASIDTENAKELRDARSFLVRLTRSRDLLLDQGQGQWLLMICSSQDRVPEYLTRAEEEQRSLNRNRPAGPLPPVNLRYLRTFRTTEHTESILTSLETPASGVPTRRETQLV